MVSKQVHVGMIAERRNSRTADAWHRPAPIALGPAHKTALGVAVGTVCGLGLFVLTVFHVLFKPTNGFDVGLLAQYYYRYEVSWSGAFIGLFWGFVTGFVGGWFLAFVRNLTVAIRVLILRGKAELAQIKDFLDHI